MKTKRRKELNPGLVMIGAGCTQRGYGEPVYEYRFAWPRRFRFDLAFPSLKVAFEREGGTWGTSRHATGTGYRSDCRKYNLAAAMGWAVVRGTVDMIESGTALTDLLAVLAHRSKAPA